MCSQTTTLDATSFLWLFNHNNTMNSTFDDPVPSANHRYSPPLSSSFPSPMPNLSPGNAYFHCYPLHCPHCPLRSFLFIAQSPLRQREPNSIFTLSLVFIHLDSSVDLQIPFLGRNSDLGLLRAIEHLAILTGKGSGLPSVSHVLLPYSSYWS